MNIFKYIFGAFIFQLFLFIVTIGIYFVIERLLPMTIAEKLFLTIYAPFYFLIINAGNLKGESTMIEAPVLAIAIGSVFYSLVFGFAYFSYKQYKK